MRTQSGDNRWVRLTRQMHLGQKWISDRILYLYCTRSLRMYFCLRVPPGPDSGSDLSRTFSELIPNISGLACQKDKADRKDRRDVNANPMYDGENGNIIPAFDVCSLILCKYVFLLLLNSQVAPVRQRDGRPSIPNRKRP